MNNINFSYCFAMLSQPIFGNDCETLLLSKLFKISSEKQAFIASTDSFSIRIELDVFNIFS